MKKLFITTLLMALSNLANAEIVYQESVKITQINVYDDTPNVSSFIKLTAHRPECPNGVYLNPTAPNYESMYAIALAAFMANKTVTIQMYNDR